MVAGSVNSIRAKTRRWQPWCLRPVGLPIAVVLAWSIVCAPLACGAVPLWHGFALCGSGCAQVDRKGKVLAGFDASLSPHAPSDRPADPHVERILDVCLGLDPTADPATRGNGDKTLEDICASKSLTALSRKTEKRYSDALHKVVHDKLCLPARLGQWYASYQDTLKHCDSQSCLATTMRRFQARLSGASTQTMCHADPVPAGWASKADKAWLDKPLSSATRSEILAVMGVAAGDDEGVRPDYMEKRIIGPRRAIEYVQTGMRNDWDTLLMKDRHGQWHVVLQAGSQVFAPTRGIAHGMPVFMTEGNASCCWRVIQYHVWDGSRYRPAAGGCNTYDGAMACSIDGFRTLERHDDQP